MIYWSKICNFSSFLTTSVSFEALAASVPCDLGYESWSQTGVRGLPGGDNHVICEHLPSRGIGL